MTECSTPEAPTYQATRGLNHHKPELMPNAPANAMTHHSTASKSEANNDHISTKPSPFNTR